MILQEEFVMRWTLKKTGIVIAGTAACGAIAFFTGGLAAPAIGAIIGGASGLSGAAATSAGLAALGGGALAAGGGGMAAGVALVQGAAVVVGAGAGAVGAIAASATLDNHKNCPNCNFIIQVGSEYCPNCGKEL